jgi:kynurenine formamidase
MNPETLDINAASAAQRVGAALGSVEVLDLSWSLDEKGPVFPGQEGFVFEKLGDVNDPDLPLCFAKLTFMEHIGTHMDAPAHAVDGGQFIDELGFEQLVAPAFKLDLRDRCGGSADYDVSAQDIARFERDHGPIAEGSIVLLHTGWDVRYVSPDRYIEVADDGSWHWPGLGADAAEMLADRRVRGVGIDSIGLDGGHVAMTLAAHRVVLGTGAFILENLANLADVPPRNTFVIAAPLKTRNGSGGPTRVYAFK